MNVRWSIVVPEETDRTLRAFLARRGTKKGDISRFVEEAVQSRLFELTVESIKERNRPHDPNEIMCSPECSRHVVSAISPWDTRKAITGRYWNSQLGL